MSHRNRSVFAAVLCACAFVFLSGIECDALHAAKRSGSHSHSAKSKSKSKRKSSWKETIIQQANAGYYRALGHSSKAALIDGVSISRLAEYAKETNCSAYRRAIAAAGRLDRLKKETKLKLAECVQLAVYIETELAEDVKTRGNYRSRNSTGICRSVEYDPASGKRFIHLQNHGGRETLGKGYKKTVTLSVLYDEHKPELVAHCQTTIPMPEEIEAIRALQGLNGLLEVYAITDRHVKSSKTDTTNYSLMCKLYPYDTLSSLMRSGKKRRKLDMVDKMYIAHDILTGLESMHNKGFVHRDLGTRNYLIYKKKRERGSGERYAAVIADFGRTLPIEHIFGKVCQTIPVYIAPEGLIYSKLKGADYFYTDIYAVGCVLHSLFFDRSAPWADSRLVRGKEPVEKRQKAFIKKLGDWRAKRFKSLVVTNRFRDNTPVEEGLERLVLRMVDPIAKKRGTATELRQLLEYFMKRKDVLKREDAMLKKQKSKSKK